MIMTPTFFDSIIPTDEDLQYLFKAAAQPPKRHVRFDPVVAPSSKQNYGKEPENSKLWYTSDEIAAFKAHTNKLASLNEDQAQCLKNECMRGVEHGKKHRVRNQMLSNLCILRAQRKGCGTEEIAAIERKCSEWSQEMARIWALKDYYDVYQPSSAFLIPRISSSPPQFSLMFKKKRAVSLDEPNSSPKRLRTCDKENDT